MSRFTEIRSNHSFAETAWRFGLVQAQGLGGRWLVHRIVLVVGLALLAACASTQEPESVFTSEDFAQLRFLEGRWEGTGPDGKPFYEQYAFTSEGEMRSTRFTDATFSEAEDGSVVALDGDRVVSTWGEFTWQASELAAGRACFAPVNAPSSFCWERLSDSSARVTQRWTDEHGKPQHYVVPLRRLKSHQ